MGWAWHGIVLFVVTNLDDLVVLALFFGRANGAADRSRIVVGQYVGFGAILLVSVGLALGAAQLPDGVTAYLGLIPIGIGLHAAWRTWRDRPALEGVARPMSLVVVAGVTLANGGDNVGVYVPALARYSVVELAGVGAIFLVLVAVWCVAGALLAAHRAIASAMTKTGHVVYPVALVVIGVIVLVSGNAFGL